jgi:hypothetical protein
VLAHIEALLRHSHSTQRGLLQLRSEAPPPRTTAPPQVVTKLQEHAAGLQREWDLLGQIIQDLISGVESLGRSPQDLSDEHAVPS